MSHTRFSVAERVLIYDIGKSIKLESSNFPTLIGPNGKINSISSFSLFPETKLPAASTEHG